MGRIVEVEAYGGVEDRASHARFGRTSRNAVMFGPAGMAYVYLVYGMHECLNVTCGEAGAAGAVLLRAVEPIAGIERMRASRAEHARTRMRRPAASPGTEAVHRLCQGPGRLGAAFGIGREMTGTDLCDATGSLRLEIDPAGPLRREIVSGPRIGIAFAGEPWTSLAWRFWLADSRSVSGG